MKILIASDISPRRIDSYERYHFGTAGALEEAGWEVLSLFSGPIADHVRRHFEIRDAAVIADLGNPHDRQRRRVWMEVIRRERPDVVWTHFLPIYSRFALGLRRAAPGAVICQSDRISRGAIRRGLVKATLHRLRIAAFSGCFDRHITVSQFVADRLIQSDGVPADRVQVIHNGVDLDAFLPGHSIGRFLLAVCYLRPEKGIAVLLEALGRLRRQGVDIPCRIVGDGPCLEDYQELARTLGLRDRVEFLGLRDDVDVLLRDAMIAVVPSIWPEAFSFTAAEAQASGVPVIASDIGGLPEVVDHAVSGLLVPPNDPDALAQAIASLAQDRSRRDAMGRAGRDRAERLFGLDRMIRQTVEFLRDAVAERNASGKAKIPSRS